jgi:hypothetical protein
MWHPYIIVSEILFSWINIRFGVYLLRKNPVSLRKRNNTLRNEPKLRKEHFMSVGVYDKYETEDGKVFDNQQEAQAHANKIGNYKERGRQALYARSKRSIEQIINCFNAGDWNGVLAVEWNYILEEDRKMDLVTKRELAKAYRDNNYDNLLLDWLEWHDMYDDFKKEIFKGIKTIWEKKNGRTLTETDIAKLKIKAKELKKEANSTSSSSSSYSDEKRGIFLSLVFGAVGGLGIMMTASWLFVKIAKVESMSSSLFIFITLAAGAVITFISWRNRWKLFFPLIIAAVFGWLVMFGIIPT